MFSEQKENKWLDFGILFLRVGLGVMFILHGMPKLFGGPESWETIGQATQYVGIDFAPMFFGFMAAVAEFFGGILLLLGLFWVPTLSLLLATMIVAIFYHSGNGDGFGDISHPLKMAIVISSLFLIGQGRFSLDKIIFKKRRR